MGDVNLDGTRFTLSDTKNREVLAVILSTQAITILWANCEGQKLTAKVFDVANPGKTIDIINAAAKPMGVRPHKPCHTFTIAAKELVRGCGLQRMMNHTDGVDITGTHYIGESRN